MSLFRVWAPLPQTVELLVAGKTYPMQRAASGWWSAEIPGARPGDDYGYLLDGQGPYPDPRSPAQPHGTHGLSRLVDQDRFPWTDKQFNAPPLASAIIYELHVGTFTPAGTFLSAMEKLDYLVTTGITYVELMPVNEFSGDHGWGYDGVDLFAPHHAYGEPADLKKLVDACHARGLAVILDVVYNHIGPADNNLGKFGPYFTKKFATFWGEGINFDDTDSDEVRRFFCDNALMWLRDFHFDGLRLDAVHGILDTSAIHILEQLEIEVEKLSAQLGRRLVLIAESDLNNPRLLWPRACGGFQLEAQWSDDFHHALHTVLTGENTGYYSDFGKLSDLATALQQAYVYAGRYSPHRRRRHGRSPAGLGGHRFLGYLQNHDQIGNRALGERSGRLMSLGRLKVGAGLVLTSPFVPMLFQGEEWGATTPFLFFTNHQEPALAQAVREGRCHEFAAFGWKPEDTPDPQAPETHAQSKLKWEEINDPAHAEILEWHKKLIHLRQQEMDLNDGQIQYVQVRFDEAEKWLVVERGMIRVACNLGEQSNSLRLPERKNYRLLAASESGVTLNGNNLALPPDSLAIVKET